MTLEVFSQRQLIGRQIHSAKCGVGFSIHTLPLLTLLGFFHHQQQQQPSLDEHRLGLDNESTD